MNPREIVELLISLRAEKKRHDAESTRIMNEIIELAVSLGLPQEDLPKVHLLDFFDGYLIGKGHIQSFRKSEDELMGNQT